MKNKTKFWPVFASLVELPPIIRESKNNKLIAGVWYGYNDPCSDVLFESLFNEINKLKKNGIEIELKDRKVKILVNIYGLIADAPAKALCLNIKGPNGYFSCPYCLIKGEF